MSFESEYSDLLLKQFWDKPKAKAEIELKAATLKRIFNFLNSFTDEFDLDLAYGDRLDKIGKIVGLPRLVNFVIPKIAFGFDENPNARGFDDKFLGPLANSAPFQDKFESSYTSLQLNDNDYRLFLKAKIAKNNGSAYMISDEKISIQEVINILFEGQAYVIDKQNMRLLLNVSPVFDIQRLTAIKKLGLLPKPQGVRYDIVTQTAEGDAFGFSDNVLSKGFANKFDLINEPGGRFLQKVII